ncbi:hypothetical protein [Mycolicibacterium setense]|uniref:hypothetical protein n=1 Tax=Mycolicibacterium setense TaxID=431269 RepID=UPI000573AA0D|nr:hypothetical protein [Mycolicibacterium setense]KHO21334.1 hypothetical protein QQ25_11990 [Mycolicibacterium setense]MCV7114623.1 hypothetical protein [Mycolicibacterium setense]OBB15969.1 hypothetical protein A5761_13335 [Mycolicibacterium setense]
MTGTTRMAVICAVVAATFGVAGCGGSTSSTTESATTSAGATSATATTSAAQAPTATPSKVSANTASEDEIASALEGAGVSNPERWAEEVVEYRPYPADDPNLTKLRDNLAKYNPGQETVDKIVAALTP